MSLAEKLRKPDWLNELRAVVIIAFAWVLVFSLAEVVTAALGVGEVLVKVPRNPAGPDRFTLGGQEVEQRWTEIAIADPTPAQSLWYLATRLPSAAVVLTVLFMLLRVLGRARRTDPFTRETVRSLRWQAAVLMAGGPLAGLAESMATIGLSQGLRPGSVSGQWELPVLWVLAGGGVMAVAEIVARGCALRKELDGVI